MNDQFPDKPKSIQVKQVNNEITIIKEWFNYSSLFLAIFTLVWCSITFRLYYFILFYEWTGDLGRIEIILITSPFLVGGICLPYYTIASWINKTYIFANKDAIIVRHQPIPWKGNISVRVVKLENFYSKETVEDRGDNRRIYYELHAKTLNGADKKLLEVNDSEEALFIEKTLKDYFKL